MNMKSSCCFKGILAIFAFFVASALGGSLWMVFDHVWRNPELMHMWRPENSDFAKWMPLGCIIHSVIFVCLYSCLGSALSCCACPFSRGAKFGFKLWLLTGFAGGISWYLVENITMEVMALFMVSQLVTYVVGGALVSKILGTPWAACEDKGSCDTKTSCGNKNHCGSAN